MRISSFLSVAMIAATLSACTQSQVDTAPIQAAPTVAPSQQARVQGIGDGNFVGVRDATFYANGKPFKHVGVNTPQLVYQPLDQVRVNLDGLRDAGVKVVRVFLPSDGYANHWDQIARLNTVVNEAWQRGIRVTVALTHNYWQSVWGWQKGARADGREPKHAVGNDGRPNQWFSGERGFYTRACGAACPGLWMLNDQWIDWGYTAHYWAYMRDVVWNLRQHPGVFSWDIANELNSENQDAWMRDRLVAFYTRVAGEIKALDPNHLVTTGLINTSWAGLNDAQRRTLYQNANIDYVTVHHYDNERRPDGGSDAHDEIWRAKNWLTPRKPVVIEEFGMSAGRTNMQAVKDYYADMYDRRGVDAIWQWAVELRCPEMSGAYNTPTAWGGGDSVYGPCQQGRLSEYLDLYKSWSAELNRRNGR
jgi:hypothetical protein